MFEAAFDHDDYAELEFSGPDILEGTMTDVAAALRRIATPSRILLRDKLTFMAGVIGALLDAYYLGWSPSTFYRVYSIQVVVLMAVRWIVYRFKLWHYYLLDFCYAANALMLVHLWVLPHSALLHKVTFAYATGPLAWSIVAFRNSMVFHSMDKMTSLLLHWMPACVVWTLRWYPHRSVRLNFDAKSEDVKADWHHGSLWQLVVLPVLPYLLWAIAYYVKIFMISSEKIQQRGYETLFAFTTANERSLFARAIRKAPKRWQPLAYMSIHLVCVILTLLLARCFWESFQAHTIFLLAILGVSVWNGAGFYFQIFARRYLESLEQDAKSRTPVSSSPHPKSN